MSNEKLNAKRKKRYNQLWKKFYNNFFLKKCNITLGRLYLYILSIVIAVFVGSAIIFVATPLLSKLNMPIYGGYVSKELIIDNINKIDSLRAEIEIWRYYNKNIAEIIAGEKPEIKSEDIRDFAKKSIKENDLHASNYEDILKNKILLDNRFKVHDYRYEYNFYPPLKGRIEVSYGESKTGGVTLFVDEHKEVVSMNDGTVVAIYRDPNFGNVVQVQHADNMISIYGGLSKISKKVGDKLLSREVIGYVGSEDTDIAKLSTAPKTYRLYFELWHNGNRVNPENYIVF